MEYGPRRTLGPRAVLLLALAGLLPAPLAQAICDVIPHTSQQRHRGALGSADRPFASPGDWIELSASPTCSHPQPAAFVDANGDGRLQDEYRVLLVYEPPVATAPRRAVVLAEDCTGVDAQLAANGDCADASVASARCIEVNQANALPTLQTKTAVDPDTNASELRLEVRLPRGTCTSGEPVVCYRQQDCTGGASCDFGRRERVLTGPLTIAARRTTEPAPCELVPVPPQGAPSAQGTCAQMRGQPGFGACIDTLYAGETSCDVGTMQIDATFPSFTALPPPNDFRALCDDSGPYSPPCAPDAPASVRFAVDQRGNMLVPMWWQGVLEPLPPPLARFVKGSTAFPAGDGGSRPIRIPDAAPLGAYTPKGVRVPALFQPQIGSPADRELALFGLADAPQSVLRIASRPGARRGFRQCDAASTNAGEVCGRNEQCPGGLCEAQPRCLPAGPPVCAEDVDCGPNAQCGRRAHETASRMRNGVGPVEIPRAGTTGRVCNGGPADGQPCPTTGACAGGAVCVDYRAQALWHAPLHYTETTPELVITVLSEERLDQDLDGDGAKASLVALLSDARHLELVPFGVGGAPGRAVVTSATTMGSESFDFPVVAAAGSVVALVEDCARQPTPECDGSPDAPARLRVYRYAGGALAEVTSTAILPEPGDFVDGRRIAVTPHGMVFYRARTSTGAVMLHALDGRADPPRPPVAICPATLASVGGERIAFLRPESAGDCGGDATVAPVDLNGDGDTDDTVVHRWAPPNRVDNLRCAATRVAMSPDWIAATVSEAQQDETVLNDDGDTLDDVLHVHPADRLSQTCHGPESRWTNTRQSADRIAVSGSAIPLLTSEASQGQDLDGDGVVDGRVIQVVFAPGAAPADRVNLERQADEFQTGDAVESPCGRRHLLAFRTPVAAPSRLQIYDLEHRTFGALFGEGALVCDDMSCDPRRPYHVDGHFVRVLTDACAEAEEPCRQIEVHDVCRQKGEGMLVVPQPPRRDLDGFFLREAGSVRLGTGRCVENLGPACKPGGVCPGASVCRPVSPGSIEHACFADRGWCESQSDCPTQAECRPALSLAYVGDTDDD
jgi:hypothetical protein